MMSKVAVVVASSNTGAACVKALRNQDAVRVSVRAAFRSADKAELYKAEAGLSANVEVISGVDAYDTASLGNAFAGCETAVVVTPHDMSRGFDDDAMLTLNMINAAVASGVKHLIYVGSWTVTEPDGVGMIAKRFIPAEKKLEELISSNPDFTFSSLRSGFFNLNLVNMFGSLRKGNELRFPKECSFPPVDPRDVGKAAAALALVPPEQRKSGYVFFERSGFVLGLLIIRIAFALFFIRFINGQANQHCTPI